MQTGHIIFLSTRTGVVRLCVLNINTVFSPIEPPGGKAVVWGGCIRNNTNMAVSRPKMVRFSFCKKGFEEKFVLHHLRIYGGGSIGGAVILGRIR